MNNPKKNLNEAQDHCLDSSKEYVCGRKRGPKTGANGGYLDILSQCFTVNAREAAKYASSCFDHVTPKYKDVCRDDGLKSQFLDKSFFPRDVACLNQSSAEIRSRGSF